MKYREIEKLVLDIIKGSTDIKEAMSKFFTTINTSNTSKVIDILSRNNFEEDYTLIIQSIEQVLQDENPRIKVKAYWFGIFETSRNGRESFQAYIAALSKYNPHDDNFAVNPAYLPENRFLESNVLSTIHSVIAGHDEVEVRYFALWYLTLVIGIHCKINYSQFLINTSKCHICVGFDEGDYIAIGLIDSKGLKLNTVKIPIPTQLKKTKTSYEYYSLRDEMKGAWFLNEIKQSDGTELVSSFARICKPINVNEELITSYNEKYDGMPVDYCEETLCGPVVSQRVKDIVLKHSNDKEVQFVPLIIKNYPEEKYYVMNVLKDIACIDKNRTIYYEENYAKTIVLHKSKIGNRAIFRLADPVINDLILISSNLKDEFENIRLTGAKLEGIELS